MLTIWETRSLAVVLLAVLLATTACADEVASPLSAKASQLQSGMSRETVIKLLGPAQWAILPSDKGRLELPAPDIVLELRWSNPGFSNVVVDFGKGYRVVGWDEGRMELDDPDLQKALTPPDTYSCQHPERAELCGVLASKQVIAPKE